MRANPHLDSLNVYYIIIGRGVLSLRKKQCTVATVVVTYCGSWIETAGRSALKRRSLEPTASTGEKADMPSAPGDRPMGPESC